MLLGFRFEQLIGYNIDIEAKAQWFEQKYSNHPSVSITPVRLEQISQSLEAAQDFVQKLGFKKDLLKQVPDIVNQRNAKKRFEVSLETVEQEVEKFIQQYRKSNLWLPSLPHMQKIEVPTTSSIQKK
jgi:phage gp29-like protein